MGLLDMFENEEQRIRKDQIRLEKENRVLQARVELKKAQKRNDSLKKQLEDDPQSDGPA